MKTLYVYADFDWLDEPMLVGELGYESLRGSDSYSFKYDNDWLRQFGSLFLSADINNYPGQQYTQPNRDIFGCFSDALPDRWGRLLLNRREQILSPAYDMNPTLNEYQALLINSTTNHADLQVLLDSSEEYMIGKEEAGHIINEVKTGVKHWKSIATRLGIAKREMDVFEQVFLHSLK